MNSNLPYPIRKEVQIGDKRIVLLDKPVNIIYNRNVLCLDSEGNIVWQIEELPLYPGHAKACPYVEIEFIDGKLKLWNWCSFCFVVDPQTGVILERKQTH